MGRLLLALLALLAPLAMLALLALLRPVLMRIDSPDPI
jgi:hypothetical protein